MAYSRTTSASVQQTAGDRAVSYILSTSQVARDNHTIDQAGWSLDNYRANPVLLWCHDSTMPPIGRMSDVAVSGGALHGTVEYADAETFPFADVVYRLVKGKFIHAVSVSWDPIKWNYSTDRSRPGGIDFKEQELLEVSQVPVPCDTGAIATARAAGIDTRPLYQWAERWLDERKASPIPRPQIEALCRSARPTLRSIAPLPAPNAYAARLAVCRRVAYHQAQEYGFDVPARFLPPATLAERKAVVAQLRHRLT